MEVAELQVSLKRLSAEAEQLEQTLTDRETSGRAELEAAKDEAKRAAEQLKAVTNRLAQTEGELENLFDQVSRESAEVKRLRRELTTERASGQQSTAAIAKLEARLKKRQTELSASRKRVSEINDRVGGLEVEAAKLREQSAERERLANAAPVISVIEPVVTKTRSNSEATEVRSGGRLIVGKVDTAVGLAALLVNEREVAAEPSGLFRVDLEESGPEVPVEVVAIDVRGQRTELRFRLLVKSDPVTSRSSVGATSSGVDVPQGVEFGQFHALVIGINDYRLLPQLETAVNGARAVARLLREKYGCETTFLENPGRYEILSTLNKLREALTDEDNLLIYYAGHGELDRVNDRGHWLPVDAEPDSSANWISNIQITDVLNAMSARQVMVIADSCYSGTLTRAAVARLDAGMTQNARSNWLRVMIEKRSRVVLSSGGVQAVLDSGGGGHSVFTKALLGALEDNTEVLEGQRLAIAVTRAVAASASANEIGQIPVFAPIKYAGHEAGDFFFTPKS